MGKQSPPAPPPLPDPYKTAAAQTQGDVQSAIANSILQNPNVITPFGSMTSEQIGTYTIKDAQGNPIDVPKYKQTQVLSPAEQKLFDQQTAIGAQMNQLATSQLSRLGNTLGQPITLGGLPKFADPIGSGPKLATGYGLGGPIQTSLNLDVNAPTTFGQTASNIQTSVGPTDFTKDRNAVVNAVLARVQPQLDRNTDALSARLANQGITMGSQAWNAAMDANNRGITDAYTQAELTGAQEQQSLFNQALQQGQFANAAQSQDFGQQQARGQFAQQGIGLNNAARESAGNFFNAAQAQQNTQNSQLAAFANAAQQQMFNNAVTGANFDNTARQQQFQERLALRNQPINETSALMNGGQVTAPQFQQFQGGQVPGSTIGQNIMGNAALANQQWQTQAQAAAQNNAAIYGMGGALLGGLMRFSDIRLKRDIAYLYTHHNGLPVYSFRYFSDDEPQAGFMAHEVEKVHPEAVFDIGGFKAVDYEQAVR